MISQERILVEIESIGEYLKEKYNEKDGNLLAERITKLNATLARSSELLADAEYYLNFAIATHSESLDKSIAPSVAKEILKGKVCIESRVFKLTERMNRTITHQLDAIRSQLSYLKSFND